MKINGILMNSKVWYITGASRGFGRIWAEAVLTRGDKVAVTARNVANKACPVLNMMRNTLPFLLQQLVVPVLQLRGDGLDAGGLFDRPQFNALGVVSAKSRFRQLHHGMFGVDAETFAMLCEDFDGGA